MKQMFSVFGFLAMVMAPAHAEFYEPSYTERVLHWDSMLSATTEAFELDPKLSSSAKRIATGWFFLGPCSGVVERLGDDQRAGNMISAVASLKPDAAYSKAVLTMIGIMTRESFGRAPSEDLCRYALDIAKAH